MILRFLKELKSNMFLYGCFLVFGLCISPFITTFSSTIIVCVLFCATVKAIEFQSDDKDKITNWFLDNLFVFYISILFGFYGASIIDFFIAGFFIILFVNLRKFELNQIKLKGE